MPFDPNKPANDSPLNSAEMRGQLSALLDAAAPIGALKPWLKDFPGVPPLTAHWAECNGQVLGDADSPLDGQTLPNLNGAGGGTPRFLRGAGASGGTGGDETHTHSLPQFQPTLGDGGTTDQYNIPTSSITDAASSLPSYYEVVWVIRVK
jgi:hypothetical protein